MVSDFVLSKRLIDLKPLFFSINRYAAVPSERLPLYNIQPEKDGWIENCLKYIDLHKNCYLFVLNSAGGWYWSEVEAANHTDWIVKLLVRRDIDDFMVLSHDQKGFVGFIEDEYNCLAFVYEDVTTLSAAV